jgi:AcrR family transcriptional regulator
VVEAWKTHRNDEERTTEPARSWWVEENGAMAARRTGSESSKTRFLLLDTTERLMLDEGYAAVTSRRVAKEAGVTPPLVHYYFPTLDDLFIAIFRRRGDEQLERQARFLQSEQPLRALWAFSNEPAAAAFTTEFMALANHRKSIRKEIASYVDRFRQAQVEALSEAVRQGRLDIDEDDLPGLVVLLTNAGRSIVLEGTIGLTTGHTSALAFVERSLQSTEPTRGRTRRGPPRRR